MIQTFLSTTLTKGASRMSSKTCFKCGLLKPLEEFYAHPMMADGRLNKCKVCARRDANATRAARPEYYRAYDRNRAGLPHRRERAKKIYARWRMQFPNRKKAQAMFRHAMLRGEIQRWPCLICGANAEGHHPDYDRPLDVVWLCSSHHKQAHALTRRAA